VCDEQSQSPGNAMQLTPPQTNNVRSIAQQFNNLAAAAHRQDNSPVNTGTRPQANGRQTPTPSRNASWSRAKSSSPQIHMTTSTVHVSPNVSSSATSATMAATTSTTTSPSTTGTSDEQTALSAQSTPNVANVSRSESVEVDLTTSAMNTTLVASVPLDTTTKSPNASFGSLSTALQIAGRSDSNLNLHAEPSSPPMDSRLNQFVTLMAESLVETGSQDAGQLIEQEQLCRTQLERNESRVSQLIDSLRRAGASSGELDKVQLHVDEVEKLSKLFNSLCARLEQVQQLLGRRRKLLLQAAGSSGDLSASGMEDNSNGIQTGNQTASGSSSPSGKQSFSNQNLSNGLDTNVSAAPLTPGCNQKCNVSPSAPSNHHNHTSSNGGWRTPSSRLRACASTDSLLDQSSAFSSLLSLSSVSLNGTSFGGSAIGQAGLSLELLLSKRNKLLDQLEEAAELRASIERRAQQLHKRILSKYDLESDGDFGAAYDPVAGNTDSDRSSFTQTDLDEESVRSASFAVCMQDRHHLLLRQRQLQRAIQTMERNRVV
jgi:hypothetical protein